MTLSSTFNVQSFEYYCSKRLGTRQSLKSRRFKPYLKETIPRTTKREIMKIWEKPPSATTTREIMEIGKQPASAFRTTETESSRLPLVTNAKRLTSIVTSDMPSVLKGRTSSYSTAVLNRIKINFSWTQWKLRWRKKKSKNCNQGISASISKTCVREDVNR